MNALTAMITGATSGIGLAFTKKYAKEGYDLILVARDEARLEREKKAIQAWKPDCRVQLYALDLSESGAALELMERIRQDGFAVDVLINNAGFGLVGQEVDLDSEKERRMLTLLVETPTMLCKECLKDMYDWGAGQILNVASTGAFQPGPYIAAYFAAKSYVYQYSRAIHLEAKKRGVQVSVVCPGTTRTKFFEKAGQKTPIWAMNPEKVADIAFEEMILGKDVIVPGLMNQLLRFVPSGIKARGVALLKK